MRLQYTYEEINNMILIRESNDKDLDQDIFDTLEECKRAIPSRLKQDVFISLEVIQNMFF